MMLPFFEEDGMPIRQSLEQAFALAMIYLFACGLYRSIVFEQRNTLSCRSLRTPFFATGLYSSMGAPCRGHCFSIAVGEQSLFCLFFIGRQNDLLIACTEFEDEYFPGRQIKKPVTGTEHQNTNGLLSVHRWPSLVND